MLRVALAVLLSLGVLLSAGCQSIRSVVRVPARETFVFGGDGSGSFRLTASNVGPVAITLVERQADGTETDRGTLAPGARAGHCVTTTSACGA